MKALIIVLSILLFLLILLFSRLTFSLTYEGSIRLSVRYLCFSYTLYPQKKKKGKKKKERKKSRKKRPPPHEPPKKEKRRLTISDIRFLLRIFAEATSTIFSKASRHIRITIKKLSIHIGGANDAARCAIEYGVVSQAVSYFLFYLHETAFLKVPKEGAITVKPAFLESGYSLQARLRVACPIVFLIPLLLSSLKTALVTRKRWHRHKQTSKNKHKNRQKESYHG